MSATTPLYISCTASTSVIPNRRRLLSRTFPLIRLLDVDRQIMPMRDDSILDEEREKLFAMVWERSAKEVARELGISDVALGKLCRRLQVPKPPRGYWSRVASGETPRRPPLTAFRAAATASASGRRGRDERSGRVQSVKLSQL